LIELAVGHAVFRPGGVAQDQRDAALGQPLDALVDAAVALGGHRVGVVIVEKAGAGAADEEALAGEHAVVLQLAEARTTGARQGRADAAAVARYAGVAGLGGVGIDGADVAHPH